MNNRQYIDSKNYKDPSLLDAFKGRGGDTEMRDVDGEPSHVNLMEAYILDQTREDGIPEVGEAIVKEIGSGTINPETGKKEYQAEALAAAGTDPSMLMQMGTSAAGTAKEGGGSRAIAKSALMAIDPTGGLLVMAGDMIYQGAQAAKANAKKMKELGQGIDEINAKRTQLGETAREDIANIWEGVGSKLSDIRSSVGTTLEGVSKKVSGVIRGGKGLATGAAEEVVSETTTNVQDAVTRQTENLQDTADIKIDAYGRKMEDETESMNRAIKDMYAEKTELSKKDDWWENIL